LPQNIEVIIPAYNEENNIGKVIAALPKILARIIVVDNGSTDKTPINAKEAGAFVVSEPLAGYGRACLTGIASLCADTQIVVFLDGDYSDYPEELTKLIAPIINQDYDFVLGSRTMLANPGLTIPQKFGNWLACRLIGIFYKTAFTDLGPFRAIKAEKLAALHMNDKNYGWTVEMQIKASKMGMKILEVPVKYRERFSGKSKVSGNIRGVFKAGFKILFLIFKHLFIKQK
jgi:glycosyltransferase involved in cell wall biosynthesis